MGHEDECRNMERPCRAGMLRYILFAETIATGLDRNNNTNIARIHRIDGKNDPANDRMILDFDFCRPYSLLETSLPFRVETIMPVFFVQHNLIFHRSYVFFLVHRYVRIRRLLLCGSSSRNSSPVRVSCKESMRVTGSSS